MTQDTKPSSSPPERDRRRVFTGRRIHVFVDRVQEATGRIAHREVVHLAGAVAIVARPRPGEALLVRQPRHAAGQSLWELPAGTLEDGESPLACARRELLEETGFEADNWSELTTFYSTPGVSDERITLFLAEHLTQVGAPDPAEIDACRPFTVDALSRLAETDALCDAKTLLGLLWTGLLNPPAGSRAR